MPLTSTHISDGYTPIDALQDLLNKPDLTPPGVRQQVWFADDVRAAVAAQRHLLEAELNSPERFLAAKDAAGVSHKELRAVAAGALCAVVAKCEGCCHQLQIADASG